MGGEAGGEASSWSCGRQCTSSVEMLLLYWCSAREGVSLIGDWGSEGMDSWPKKKKSNSQVLRAIFVEMRRQAIESNSVWWAGGVRVWSGEDSGQQQPGQTSRCQSGERGLMKEASSGWTLAGLVYEAVTPEQLCS